MNYCCGGYTINDEPDNGRYAIRFDETHSLLPSITLYIYKTEVAEALNVRDVGKRILSLIERAEKKYKNDLSMTIASSVVSKYRDVK